MLEGSVTEMGIYSWFVVVFYEWLVYTGEKISMSTADSSTLVG